MRISFVVITLDYFISHRLDLAKNLAKLHEVHVITSTTNATRESLKEIADYGIYLHHLPGRNELSKFLGYFEYLISLRKLIKFLKLDHIFYVTTEMSVLGALINNTMKIKKSYFLITGLGPFFFSKKPKYILYRFIKKIIFICLRVKKNYLFIFQNNDDLEIFLNKKLSQNHNSTVIRGNGINTNQFKYFKRDSSDEIIFLFASKLIYSKGIIEFMNASKELNGKYKGIKFHIAGNYDQSNPDSISREDFEMIQASEYFEYQGFVDIKNMQECLYKSTILVLPSYAEGLPKIALEAAATGMPLILTNVRGCRDCLIEEKNGVLVNIKDHEDIKNAMQKFIDQKELINVYGKFSSELVNEKFSLDIITQQFLAIID